MQAIVDEVASVIVRTGYTVFVKETQDFGTVLFTPAGEVFAVPLRVAVSLGPGMPCRAVVEAIGKWEEGDIVVTNDPYKTKGMVTHLADIYLIKPLFAQGQLVCFACAFIHSSDVGGKVPGSISPACYDIYQEGVRIRPVKLFEQGHLNNDILHFMLDNCRIPEQNWGDIRALLAGLDTAERRMAELIDRYGLDAVHTGIDSILNYAERKARDLIRQIPDGCYEAWDYLEGDGFSDHPIRVKVRMTIRDDEIHLDFTGTDHQVRGAFNMPSFNHPGHFMLSPTITRFLRTLDPGIPYNSGLVRPIRQHIPRANLLNAEEGAPCGVRAATMIRVADVTMAALSRAWPERLPAGGAGQVTIVLLSTLEIQSGNRKVGVIQPITGGSGARPWKDGIDSADFSVGFLKNIPSETLETEMPILVERYGLRMNSGGPGRFRGGCGNELRIRIFAPETILTARGMERHRFRPWGRAGGFPGEVGEATINEGTESERKTSKIDELLLNPGESITFLSQGGGGYGSPLNRDPEAVLADVEASLVSEEAARRDCGVVVFGGGVDHEMTSQLRESLKYDERFKAEPFNHGTERAAFEAIWDDVTYSALVEAIAAYPPSFRGYLKNSVMSIMNRRAQGEAAEHSFGEVASIVRSVVERFSSINA